MKLVEIVPANYSGITHLPQDYTADALTPKIPREWKYVLETVQMYFPQAVIAGGALRDLWHNKPVKDVDIFIPVQEPEDNLWLDQVSHLDSHVETIVTNVYGQDGNKRLPGFRHLHAIYRLTQYSLPFELIFIKAEPDDKHVSDAFDINICQIEFNGSYTYATMDFAEGSRDQVIKVVSINRADRQQHRVDRMLAKFPGWTVHVPPEFQPQ